MDILVPGYDSVYSSDNDTLPPLKEAPQNARLRETSSYTSTIQSLTIKILLKITYTKYIIYNINFNFINILYTIILDIEVVEYSINTILISLLFRKQRPVYSTSGYSLYYLSTMYL